MNKKYQIIYPEEIPSLIKDAEWIAIDTETTGLNHQNDEIVEEEIKITLLELLNR